MPAPGVAAPAAQVPRAATAAQRYAMLLLVMFLIVFPKGGVKLGGAPVTWGYLVLVMVAFTFPFAVRAGAGMELSRARLITLAALIPFQLTTWASVLTHGIHSLNWVVALIVAFFFIPVIFLLMLAPYVDTLDLSYLFRLIRWGIFFVAVYGIFLFFYKLKTGEFLEIPFLTVNAGDAGELEGKHNNRGGMFKLISTYNNGNLYGVSILLLLPLYTFLERSWVRTSIVKASLVLSLSRTVWIGLVLFEIAQRIYVRRITVRALGLLGGGLLATGAAVWYAAEVVLGRSLSTFILDRNFGGRVRQVQDLELSLLPTEPFTGVAEMVYLAILEQFGFVGLITFLFAMGMPLVLHLLGCTPFARTELKRSAAAGLAVYLVVSISDGALLLIPVMAFYWFVVSLLLSANPAFADDGTSWKLVSKSKKVRRTVAA